MGYKLWLPGDPEPGTEEFERATTRPRDPAATRDDARQPIAHELFLTRVAPAFRRMVERLEPLLADQWLGASERIRRIAPDAFDAINAAEERTDQIARDFMAGRASEAQFLGAVDDYERAWRQAGAVLADQGVPQLDRAACTGCGRTDLVVLLHMDDGTAFCRRCLAGDDPRKATS